MSKRKVRPSTEKPPDIDVELFASLNTVRKLLLALTPSGEAGFEGVVASLIASITKVQIRLAKSGAQFGRDASSPRDIFSVAIEAKRYDAPLRLDDLLGKAASASLDIGEDTDLWIVAATSEIGDGIIRKLTPVVEGKGMCALFLDWSPRGVPPIVVLLASEFDVTGNWFLEHHPGVSQSLLKDALAAVRAWPGFSNAESGLRASLSSSQVGLHAFRQRNALWLRQHWSDALLSQQEFHQIITPLDGSIPQLSGRASRFRVNHQMKASDVAHVLAVLGEEGVGKTWLVTDWWLNTPDKPILIPVIGRAVELLDDSDPLASLAEILKVQYSESGIGSSGWRRRLQRWSQREVSRTPWLVVVLDGLDERTDMPWADLLNAFGRAISSLGGMLFVTCRPGFWKREVESRLSQQVDVEEITIPEYSTSEVEQLLVQQGVTPSALPERLKAFLRNARICSVALSLFSDLRATPEELTIERLQLEYWRQRMRERGNLVQHTARDFNNLLQAHAKEWLSNPSGQFYLDELPGRDSLAKRIPAAIAKDLSDIVEGRFMSTSQNDENAYEFRPQALPFALGLLLNHELGKVQLTDETAFTAQIESLVEPVRAFELTSEILAAAFGLCCLDASFPDGGRRALLKYWSSLQHLDAEAIEAMSPNVLLKPGVFCDVLEEMHRSPNYYPHKHELENYLSSNANHPHIRATLDGRIPAWLNRWCRKALPFPGRRGKENPEREGVASDIALLSPKERDDFKRRCSEVFDPYEARTDELAVLQLFAGAIAPYSLALWAWFLAQAIAGDYTDTPAALHWAIWWNPFDWEETAKGLRGAVDDVTSASSEPYRRAAAAALRLLADVDSETKANALDGPLTDGKKLRAVSRFCESNPHDPKAVDCKNVSAAVDAIAAIDVLKLRTSRFSTEQDSNFDSATPALARFAIEPLVFKIRELASSIEKRHGVLLQALCWDLPEYSAALDQEAVSKLEEALERFAQETDDWSTDNQLIVHEMIQAIFPHVGVERQIEILLLIPQAVVIITRSRGSLKEASSEQVEIALERAQDSSNSAAAERILFLASVHPVPFTPKAREIVKALTKSDRSATRNVAFDAIRTSGDQELYEYILHQTVEDPFDIENKEEFYRREAVVAAVIQSHRIDLLHLVPIDLRQAAAAQLDDDAILIVLDEVEASLARLLQPISEAADPGFAIIVDATPDGLMQRVSFSLEVEGDASALIVAPESSVRQFNDSQLQRREAYSQLNRQLGLEGARALLAVPSQRYIARLVQMRPATVKRWLESIGGQTNYGILRQVANLAAALAGRYAKLDGALAAKILRLLEGIQTFYRISNGVERIPLYLESVFSESASIEMDELRSWIVAGATNDAELELIARAASVGGSRLWLQEYIRAHHQDEHAGRRARAVTLAGLCSLDEDVSFVLEHPAPSGLLDRVYKYATKERARASWAEHWCRSALQSDSVTDFWRFGKLAEGVVDRRFVHSFERGLEVRPQLDFEPELYERLDKAAQERGKKREKTLFGNKAPSDQVIRTLQMREAR